MLLDRMFALSIARGKVLCYKNCKFTHFLMILEGEK